MSMVLWVLWTQLTLLTLTSPGGVKVAMLDPQPQPHLYTSEAQCLEAVLQEALDAPTVTRTMGKTRLVVVPYAWCMPLSQMLPQKE